MAMTTPVFNLEKSLQVVLYVANKLQRKDFHKIFKIIYFADRDHLSKYGRTITGDTFIAMKDGPVPSKIYDIFKSVRGDGFFAANGENYKKLFEIHDWDMVKPNVEPDLNVLSDSDLEVLDSSLNQYGSLEWGEIRERSHDYAWRSTTRDRQISLEHILRESGDSEEYIAHIKEQIELQKSCL